jgi:short-subunit dehydrogenase
MKFPRALARSAEQVAQDGYRGLQQGARLVVPGLGNKLITVLVGMLPRGQVLDVAARLNRGRS